MGRGDQLEAARPREGARSRGQLLLLVHVPPFSAGRGPEDGLEGQPGPARVGTTEERPCPNRRRRLAAGGSADGGGGLSAPVPWRPGGASPGRHWGRLTRQVLGGERWGASTTGTGGPHRGEAPGAGPKGPGRSSGKRGRGGAQKKGTGSSEKEDGGSSGKRETGSRQMERLSAVDKPRLNGRGGS